MSSKSDDLSRELRAFALAYPGAEIKSPWPGHEDVAVKGKTFVYLRPEGHPFSISCKLPFTGEEALELPWTEPTGYGLGKSGWVSADPPQDALPDAAFFKAWIDESYRAQAPKSLVKQIVGIRWDKAFPRLRADQSHMKICGS